MKIVTNVLIVLVIAILFLPSLFSASTNEELDQQQTNNDSEEQVDIDITAGGFGRNMGFGVAIDVYNYETTEVLIDYSITRDRYFVKDLAETYTNNFTVPPEEVRVAKIGVGNQFMMYNLNISAWHNDNKITKTGVSIGEFVILN